MDLAKHANIAKCHKLKKWEIFRLLFTDAAVYIQRIARRRARYRPINIVDPISQCELGPSPFLLISSAGIVTGFDANMLRKYIESSHIAVNPITQDAIGEVELYRLQMRTGGKKLYVDENKKQEYESYMNVSLVLQRDIGDTVQELLESIETSVRGVDRCLIYNCFPELIGQITNYALFDGEGCRHVLDQCIERIRACQTHHYEDLNFLANTLAHMKQDLFS